MTLRGIIPFRLAINCLPIDHFLPRHSAGDGKGMDISVDYTLWFLANGLAAFGLAALVNWLTLRPWRRAAAEHWTERARLLWPAQIGMRQNWLPIATIPTLLAGMFSAAPFDVLAGYWLAGLVGAMLGNFPASRELFPRSRFGTWAGFTFIQLGFFASRLAAIAGAALLMPADPGWEMLAVCIGYVAYVAATHYGLFIFFLSLARIWRPASPRLLKIVAETSARTGVPVRKTWQVGGESANAMAFPLRRELIFTDRLLEICTDEELSAVCAHELAHLNEPTPVVALRLLRGFWPAPLIFSRPVLAHLGPLWFMAFLAVEYGLLVATRRLSPRMERRADEAATQEQSGAGVYARALEKLHQANHIPAVFPNQRLTHPHLYDRLIAAGVVPDYPRLPAPETSSSATRFLCVALGVEIAVFLARTSHG